MAAFHSPQVTVWVDVNDATINATIDSTYRNPFPDLQRWHDLRTCLARATDLLAVEFSVEFAKSWVAIAIISAHACSNLDHVNLNHVLHWRYHFKAAVEISEPTPNDLSGDIRDKSSTCSASSSVSSWHIFISVLAQSFYSSTWHIIAVVNQRVM